VLHWEGKAEGLNAAIVESMIDLEKPAPISFDDATKFMGTRSNAARH
jgi:hypothetical protein